VKNLSGTERQTTENQVKLMERQLPPVTAELPRPPIKQEKLEGKSGCTKGVTIEDAP
jgi:hypothetical protein